jgi:hypothetical protein
MAIADLDGASSTNGSKWRTTITFSIKDANHNSVPDAKVYGTWSYGKTANCTADADGLCSLTSDEFEAAKMGSLGFRVDNIAHPEPLVWAYQAANNVDADDDSDGASITMQRPAPIAMAIADMDGSGAAVSSSEWQATLTITVLDANGQPVPGAVVTGSWSNGSSTDCTTDAAGQCSRTSAKLKLVEVGEIVFSVEVVTHSESLRWAYQPPANADPDGDSNGSSITLSRPQ